MAYEKFNLFCPYKRIKHTRAIRNFTAKKQISGSKNEHSIDICFVNWRRWSVIPLIAYFDRVSACTNIYSLSSDISSDLCLALRLSFCILLWCGIFGDASFCVNMDMWVECDASKRIPTCAAIIILCIINDECWFFIIIITELHGCYIGSLVCIGKTL